MHPENIDGHAPFLNFKAGARVSDGMTAIRSDDQVGAKIALALRSFDAHTSDAQLVEDEIDNFMLQVERKGRKEFRFGGEEVQEIPLRHESDELAMGRQTREIGHRGKVTIENAIQSPHFLVRQLEEFIEQAELVHELEGGWMNGVAAKIAIEICVLFQHHDIDPGTCKQIPGHHSGRPAADYHAAGSNLRQRAHGLDYR